MKAIRQNETALQYASPRLQNDKKVVLKAMKRGGFVLQFASEKLKNDKKFIYYTDALS